MNKSEMDKGVYERYMDATVALFMEHYSNDLADDIREELEAFNGENTPFPQELDAKCRELIRKECARQRRKELHKVIMKSLRYAAIFAVSVLSLFSLLFVSVEAFRLPIINFYIEHSNGHWNISTKEEGNTEPPSDLIDPADPLSGLLPEGYTLERIEGDSLSDMTAVYTNADGAMVFLSAYPAEGETELDSEDAQTSQKCEIQGYSAVIVEEDDAFRIVWIHESRKAVFSLIANSLRYSDAISIVEDFIFKLDN